MQKSDLIKFIPATIVSMLFSLLAFSGCSVQQSENSSRLPQRNLFSPISEFLPEGNLELLAFEMGSDGFSTDQGFYRFVPLADASNVLYYIDYDTHSETVVCNRPECTHTDESCTAWFPYSGGAMLPIPIGDKLVLLCGGNPDYIDIAGDTAAAHIELMDANGANRKQTYTFNGQTAVKVGSGTLRHNFVRDEQNLYFIAESYEKGENGIQLHRVLCAYDTVSNRLFNLKTLDPTSRIIGAYEDNIVLESTPKAQKIDTDAVDLLSTITTFSLSSQQETQIGEHAYLAYGRCDGAFYYFLTPSGSLECIDLQTGDFSTVTTQVFSEDLMQKSYSLNSLWDHHLFVTFEIFDPSTNKLTRKNYSVDLQNGTSQEREFFYPSELGELPQKIVAKTETEYLLVTHTESLSVEVPISKTETTTIPYDQNIYATIPISDFWNGITTHIVPIQELS